MEGEEQVHSGYQFESGMFARARSWTDLFPWIALVRVMRLLASPTAIAVAAIAWLLSGWVVTLFVADSLTAITRFRIGQSPGIGLGILSELLSVSWPRLVGVVIALLVIWIPVSAVLTRQGAALTAARDLPEFRQTLRLFVMRWSSCFVVPTLPILCVVGLLAALFVLRLPSVAIGWEAFSTATGWLLGILVLPAGLIGFGALVAIPLASAAMMCEPDPDPIDSLSRGYEYLYRRPLHLLWYAVVCSTIVFAVRVVFSGVFTMSGMFIQTVSTPFGHDEVLVASASLAIGAVWTGAQITLTLGLLGGVYLLLRHDAGGQHVEEFWIPKSEPLESLPELPEKAYQ